MRFGIGRGRVIYSPSPICGLALSSSLPLQNYVQAITLQNYL